MVKRLHNIYFYLTAKVSGGKALVTVNIIVKHLVPPHHDIAQ